MPEGIQRRRRRLWEEDPHCHWCGVETTWETPAHGKLSNTAATLDHWFSKLEPERRYHPGGPHPVVLACQQCNRIRAKAACKAFGHNPPTRRGIQPTPGLRPGFRLKLRRRVWWEGGS